MNPLLSRLLQQRLPTEHPGHPLGHHRYGDQHLLGHGQERLLRAGFTDAKDATAHVIRKPGANGEIREFPVFLIVGQREINFV